MHAENKTLKDRETVFKESIALLARHYRYVPVRWIYGYRSFQRDRRDQFFEPLRYSALTYLSTLAAGLRYNRAHPMKYVAEWLSAFRPSNLLQLRTARCGSGGKRELPAMGERKGPRPGARD